jgi:hypothetical protein
LKFDLGVDPRTGKRQTRYHSFKGSKREAQAELTRLLSTMDMGSYVDISKVTVADFLDRWERDWASMNVSPKTFEYRQLIKLNVIPHIGSVSVQKLRPVDLNELYATLLRSGGRPRSLNPNNLEERPVPLSPEPLAMCIAFCTERLGMPHYGGWSLRMLPQS